MRFLPPPSPIPHTLPHTRRETVGQTDSRLIHSTTFGFHLVRFAFVPHVLYLVVFHSVSVSVFGFRFCVFSVFIFIISLGFLLHRMFSYEYVAYISLLCHPRYLSLPPPPSLLHFRQSRRMQKDNRAGLMNHGLLFIKCNRVNDCRHSRKRAGILCQRRGGGESIVGGWNHPICGYL